MRFVVMIACFVAFSFAETLPQAPQPYKKESSPDIKIGGEILLRYERQQSSSDTLKRAPKGSQGSLNLMIDSK